MNFNKQKIIVQKFGGSSLADADRLKSVAKICYQSKQAENCQLVVVVSAMGDTTDELVSLIRQVNQQGSAQSKAMILSSGEQVSAALLAMAIEELGQKSACLTGWQAGIQTSDNPLKAKIKNIDTSTIKKLLAEDNIVIVTGFQGLSDSGQITTLGRGGSDTSAVALAAALQAECCDIYTDVDYIRTSDPRIIKQTGKLKHITYDEMLELSNLGAQVLHPRSVEIAKSFRIPVRLRSSWQADNRGTLLGESFPPEMIESKQVVRGVAINKDICRLSIRGVSDQPGIASLIFCSLADRGVSVDLIVQNVSQDNLTEVDLTISSEDVAVAEKELRSICQKIDSQSVSIDREVAKVSIVGAGMIDEPGIAAKMFKTLGQNNINIQMISTSEILISCLVHRDEVEMAAQLIHDAFQLDQVQS